MKMRSFTKPFSSVKRDALSLQEAITVFNALADMREISFGYTITGCLYRAHIMCRELSKRGIVPKRAWAYCPEPLKKVGLFGKKEALRVRHPRQTIEWYYHVAPAVSVRMPNGKQQDMVFDPSLFNGPATLKEWGDIQGAKASQIEIRPLTAPPRHRSFIRRLRLPFEQDEIAAAEMKKYFSSIWWTTPKNKPRQIFTSQLRRAFSNTGSLQGKTWQTIPGRARVNVPKP